MFPAKHRKQAEALLAACCDAKIHLTVAESCTGGLLSALLTDIPGSSSVFECGFITYSNDAKTEMLGVPKTLLDKHGAVSAEVARAMAEGAIANSNASLSASITGIAGPDGGTLEKPVGLVYIGIGLKSAAAIVHEFRSQGSRQDIRLESVTHALALLTQAVNTTL